MNTCDRCPAEAQVTITTQGGLDLHLCGHHFWVNHSELYAQQDANKLTIQYTAEVEWLRRKPSELVLV